VCSRRFIALLLAFSLYGPLFPALSFSEDQPSLTAYASELNRLQAISARLKAISLQLELKLEYSSRSLQALTAELDSLKAELADIRNKLQISLDRSDQLAEMLKKSEDSLTSLEPSFKEYKDAAETKIKRLERENKALKWIAGGLAVAAIAAGTAWAMK